MYTFDLSLDYIKKECNNRKSKIVKRSGVFMSVSVAIWKDGEPWRRVDLFRQTKFEPWLIWAAFPCFDRDVTAEVLRSAGYIA